jgi:hypothetical protein
VTPYRPWRVAIFAFTMVVMAGAAAAGITAAVLALLSG